MKCKVYKISENDNTFRTPLEEIDTINFLPREGHRLHLGSSTHESGGIITSVVVSVKEVPEGLEVETTNSLYLINLIY